MVRDLAALQNGNRGFGSLAPRLLIVSGEMQSFFGSSERNQIFIDGGLFSMSLLFGLHAMGLGACPLNWSVSFRQDRKLRRKFRIPESEAVIMIISLGYLPETLSVPKSVRYPLSGVMSELHYAG